MAPFRLSVSDFQGSAYLVHGATGRQELASGLDELWSKAQAILGRPLDPLDSRVLDYLETTP